DEEGLSFSALKKKSGLSWQAAHEHLEKLVGEGLIRDVRGGFPRTRRLYLTEEGRKVYEAFKKTESVEKTVSINKVVEAFKARLKKTMPYLEPFLTDDKLEALAKYYGIVLTLGLYKPYSARCAELVDQLASSLKTVALTPPPEKSEEEEAFIEALLFFLTHLLKCGSFREKVAKERRLTFLLDLDLSSVQLTDEDLRAALFFALAHQELRREGKV
ncbi:MAG: hypothetical protein QXI60_11760, partial [Thermofilaceae archaeon]